jgi:protein-L-isoaspartate O-methyltransferase
MNEISDYYSRNADRLIDRYEKLAPQAVHAAWIHLVPETRSRILDVGAGSGRDAAWFAGLGHCVIAVEPADNLRKKAIALHSRADVRWIKDRLPGLNLVHRLNAGFDVILVSAVWMHLTQTDRPRAFESLYTLLNPAGILIISIRYGPVAGRPAMFPATGSEIGNLARQLGLDVVINVQNDDLYHRTEVRWETVVLRRQN